MKIVDLFLDFIYPPRCVICSELLGDMSSNHICDSCIKDAKYSDNETDYRDYLSVISGENIYFDYGFSLFRYDFVKESIERFKFFGERNLGRVYAHLLYEKLSNSDILKSADYITYVPLNKSRLKSRGYDQAKFLAEEFSKSAGIEFLENALVRTKDTVPQYRLKANERIGNVKGAFAVGRSDLKGNIIIIDDIFTTGATINECARVLKENGADKVGFITFALAGREGISDDV